MLHLAVKLIPVAIELSGCQQVDLDQGLGNMGIANPKGEDGGGVDCLTGSVSPLVDLACVMLLLLPDKVVLEPVHSCMGGAQGEQLQQLSQPPETLLAGPWVTTHSHNLSSSDGKGLEAKLLLLLLLFLLIICVLLVNVVVLNSRAEHSSRGSTVAGEEVKAGVHPMWS